jgi:uncharacterized protein YggE
MGKRILLAVLVAALLVTSGLAGVWIWGQATRPVAAQTSEGTNGYSPAQNITVVGQGSAHVEPDIARVTIGIETSAESVAEAVQENGAQMDSILAALEGSGIDEKDIQTSNYSVHLDRYPETLPRAIVEGEEEAQAPQPVYRVSNTVSVTIRELDRVGDVLDGVIEAGANNIWGVSFGLDDPEAAIAEARADAVADALDRAGALAELSGVELGPVMSVSEVVGGGSAPFVMAMDSVERAAAGGTSISPGELEIGYQVQVSYFIEP